MNKKLLFAGMLVAGAFALPTLAGAAMTGVCSNCHTMHNSQNGASVTTDGAAHAHLISKANGCIGCHAISGTGNSTTTGKSATSPYAPQVDDSTNPDSGGYFSSGGADNLQHNVTGIMAQDGTLGLTPPGGTALGAQLSCDTCHTGGGHHNNAGNDGNTWLNGSTVANSFRFLSGVQGVEDSDFGQETTNDANDYYGIARSLDATEDSTTGTISNLCASCHGGFHTEAATWDNANSVFIRHPTDVDMPSAYQTNYGTYKASLPLGTATTGNTTLKDGDTIATTTNTVVICLSCHQAHGNANADMLRFDYTANYAGDTTAGFGCETCHGTK